MNTAETTKIHYNKGKDIDRAATKWLVTTAPATFENVAIVSAFLGTLIGAGFITSFSNIRVGIYMISMGLFHLLEFWVTAKYNSKSLGMCSFLLTNGLGYAGAQLFAALEFLLRERFQNRSTDISLFTWLPLAGLLLGQATRTAAMIKAAQSFDHYVQVEKKKEHTLVNTGIYSLMRHPSYFGYYIWAISTQLLIRNYISFVAFVIMLNFYFRFRLGSEESALISFFGQDYVQYKKKVWSGVFFYD